ncbi:MAG TPA: LacI family DNA-binding transcriptional regulator [Acidobacteriaceae bacterium]|nr:LacI family DNA-binding transcriptional regulator [Acidobacteriaceae bacterium]
MNIKEVAKRARLSTATVSRTINGSNKVSPETARRVQRAIEALNYYPNTNARSLGSGRSRLYGLIISDITNPFFPELVKVFDDVAIQHGQEVIIANTDYDAKRTELCALRMLGRKVDGVAIMTSEMDAHLIERLKSRHIPMVFLDTGTPGPGISNIVIDYSAGVDQAIQHLVSLGHKNIAFISGPMHLAAARSRHAAFLQALKRHRLKPNPKLIEEANHRIDGGGMAMERLLQQTLRPTAVLASNDLTAIGAIGALHEHKLRVPADISVIGFDDIEMSSFTDPPLTTVRLSRTEIATRAFHALFSTLQHTDAIGAEYTLHPQLIVRKSTGPAPRASAKTE